MLHGCVFVTVGAVDVAEAVVEKFPERASVTVDVIVMDPDRYVTVAVPGGIVSESVALSVAESTPVRVVVARVTTVVGGKVGLGVFWELVSCVPVRIMMPDDSEDVDVDVVSDSDADADDTDASSALFASLFASLSNPLSAAWASEPRPRSNSPHSLKGTIVEAV